MPKLVEIAKQRKIYQTEEGTSSPVMASYTFEYEDDDFRREVLYYRILEPSLN